MPGLLIKDLPKKLHTRLKARAVADRRSLSGEVIVLLEQALSDRVGPPSLTEIDRLRVRGQKPLTQSVIAQARREGRP